MSHSRGYTFSETHFFLFLMGLICTAEVSEHIRRLGHNVEKLLLSPLKSLVRRIAKTVYHTPSKHSLSKKSWIVS